MEALTAVLLSGQAWLAGGAVLLGYMVLGVSGFGSALVVIPALLWQWPLAFVVPLVLLLDLPAALLHAWLNRRDADWQELRRLLPWMLAGVLLGALLQGYADRPWGQALLGLGLCTAALRGLQAQAPVVVAPSAWAPWAGLGMGLVESVFGVAGPVIATWLSRRALHPLALRATTVLVLAVATSLALAGMGLRGQLSDPYLWVWWLSLLLLAGLGVRAGQWLALRMPVKNLAVLTWCLVLASGLGLLWRLL